MTRRTTQADIGTWLVSDATQTVIARVVGDPRGALVALGRGSDPHVLGPQITALALAVVLAGELGARVDTELAARYTDTFAAEHITGRVEGLREAAHDLRTRADRCRRNGGTAAATEFAAAAGSLEVRAQHLEEQ